jgi:hypothetical protein
MCTLNNSHSILLTCLFLVHVLQDAATTLCAAHLGMATSGCSYNWRSNHWARQQLGADPTGCGITGSGFGCGNNWVRVQLKVRLKLGAAQVHLHLVQPQLGASSSRCSYNWVQQQLGASTTADAAVKYQ